MQLNKNGIPVNVGKQIVTKKPVSAKRRKRQQELKRLEYNQFAEFSNMVNGFEVKILIPNMKPLIEAMKQDGWTYIGLTKGEMV